MVIKCTVNLEYMYFKELLAHTNVHAREINDIDAHAYHHLKIEDLLVLSVQGQ